MATWKCALELDANRSVVSGSTSELAEAIGRAADLRIYTEFLHNEHIDVGSPSNERIREVAEFGVTYRVDQKWVAGIMSLRQPIELPNGFGPRSSMSFFMYNQDGTQAIARPYLDDGPFESNYGSSPAARSRRVCRRSHPPPPAPPGPVMRLRQSARSRQRRASHAFVSFRFSPPARTPRAPRRKTPGSEP